KNGLGSSLAQCLLGAIPVIFMPAVLAAAIIPELMGEPRDFVVSYSCRLRISPGLSFRHRFFRCAAVRRSDLLRVGRSRGCFRPALPWLRGGLRLFRGFCHSKLLSLKLRANVQGLSLRIQDSGV